MFRDIIQRNIQTRISLYAVSVVLFVFFLATIQDLLHAYRNNYSFQLDESALFNVFWLLFLPIILTQLRYFDLPNSGHWAIRLSHQIAIIALLTTIHVLLYTFLVRNLSALLLDHTYTFAKNFNYAIAEHLYKCVTAYGIIGLLQQKGVLTRRKNENADASLSDKSNYIERITVSAGRSHVTLQVGQIIYINAANPYISLQTCEKVYLYNQTLRRMEELLDPAKFIRVHRSTIINLDEVISYQSRHNGDYDILMSDRKTVRLSRNYFTDFKRATSVQHKF
ncbi:MAG: LytTR family transcriptional regulator [Sphingobacteriales bacterium]|nr:MAG: LytTR family transcriptional regulator [Sphingobacteriales bacterium]